MNKKTRNKIIKYRLGMSKQRPNSDMWLYLKFAIEIEHDLIRERKGKKERMNYKRIH